MRSRNDFGSFNQKAYSSINGNPLTQSVFVANNSEGLIAPGSPQFITTESGITISTESGLGLITEG
jgi:hypothetical protein